LKNSIIKNAFIKTTPVLFGYLFLGIAFGLLLNKSGYGVLWALFISIFVYAGSMQFVLISFLGGSTGFISIALMTLSINSRHLFYGLSFIRKFKRMGKLYYYMIFSLTDETYSLLCSLEQEETKESDKMFFTISLLDHCYWIIGSVLGSLIGNLIKFDTTGIDFAMTALFVVIFVEQWLEAKTHIPAIAGGICAVVSLLIFGPDKFILPALIAAVLFLIIFKNTLHIEESE
jgi:4-azaleucine resistance transporter AzlC